MELIVANMEILAQFLLRLSFGLAVGMAITSSRQVSSGYFRNNLYVMLGLTTLAALALATIFQLGRRHRCSGRVFVFFGFGVLVIRVQTKRVSRDLGRGRVFVACCVDGNLWRTERERIRGTPAGLPSDFQSERAA